jgi:hypothetical protein
VLTGARLPPQAFDTILSSVNRSAWTPLYLDLKDLLCCGLANDTRKIWISWTAASAAAGAVAMSAARSHRVAADEAACCAHRAHEALCTAVQKLTRGREQAAVSHICHV